MSMKTTPSNLPESWDQVDQLIGQLRSWGIINLNELDAAYQEVLAQLGQGRYPRITPQRFSERYQDVRKRL